MQNEEVGNAIGSTEPTVEEQAHYKYSDTPEMERLAERDGEMVFVCDEHHTAECGVKTVMMTLRGSHLAVMKCGYRGRQVYRKRG